MLCVVRRYSYFSGVQQIGGLTAGASQGAFVRVSGASAVDCQVLMCCFNVCFVLTNGV